MESVTQDVCAAAFHFDPSLRKSTIAAAPDGRALPRSEPCEPKGDIAYTCMRRVSTEDFV